MYAFYERRQSPFDIFRATDLNFFPHIHGQVELIRAIEGAMSVTVGDHVRTLAPGELAVVFPNTVHGCKTERDSVCQFAIFGTELVSEFAPTLAKRQPLFPFLAADALHPDALFALGALERGAPDAPELLKGYLLVVMGRVLERLALARRPAPTDEDLLHRLLAYLDEHFQKRLTLDDVGAALGCSRYQISRCFSQRIGCNFNSYVNALRAAFAADLLRRGSLSVADAGYEAGFDSLSTFYRAFVANYGQTPKAYREQGAGPSSS